MPIAQVQLVDDVVVDSTTITTTLGAAPTNGNLLVMMFMVNTDDPRVTISGLDGWTLAESRGVSSTRTYMYYKLAASDPAAKTLTFDVPLKCVLALAEYSGMAATNLLDQVDDANATGTPTSLLVSAPGTTNTAEELLVCCVGHYGNVSAPTWTDSFTAQDDSQTGTGATHLDLQWAHRIVAATGTYSTTAGWTTGRPSAGVIATFRGPETQGNRSTAFVHI